MSKTVPHETLEYVTLDTVAECFEGISDELRRKLWSLLTEVRPPGENDTPGDYLSVSAPNHVAPHWASFTPEERTELNAAAERN